MMAQEIELRASGKRGGNAIHLQLDDSLDAAPTRDRDLIALDDALPPLAAFDPRKARVVELRFFGGLTAGETAGHEDLGAQCPARPEARPRLAQARDGRGVSARLPVEVNVHQLCYTPA
jgi:hypothetical protein